MRIRPKAWLGGLVIIAALAFFASPLRTYVSSAGVLQLKTEFAALGFVRAALNFLLLYTTATLFFLPNSVLSVAAGTLFGVRWGIVLVLLAANLSANFGFLLGRYLLREQVVAWLPLPWKRFLAEADLGRLLAARLFPFCPFAPFNYFCGASPIAWSPYAMATLLGLIPLSVFYVAAGSAMGKTLHSGFEILKQPGTWGPLLGSGALVLGFFFLLRRRQLSAKAQAAESANPEPPG